LQRGGDGRVAARAIGCNEETEDMSSETQAPDPANALPEAFTNLVAAGRESLAAGDLDTARDHFAAATEQFPEEPVGHNNLGAFYMGIGAYDAAEQSFQRVADLLPDHANSLFNVGMAQFRQERYDDAIATFARTAALTPEDPEVHNNLGAARYLAGDADGARRDIVQALTLQANYPNALLNLCDIEAATGNLDVAQSLCEAYLEHHRDLGVLRRLLELLDERARQSVEQAIPHAETLAAASEDDLESRRHLGRLLEARQALTAEG
jgi:Flp pilus assembly protein TadD